MATLRGENRDVATIPVILLPPRTFLGRALCCDHITDLPRKRGLFPSSSAGRAPDC